MKAKLTASETKISFELASIHDAEELVRVHYASVHQVCKRDYQPNHLNAWSPEPSAQRFAQYRERLTSPDYRFRVARTEGEILGFGSVIFSEEKIGTLYLRPDAIGRGIGEALLGKMEQDLRERGVKAIKLMATLNAENFYTRHGYHVHARVEVPFNGAIIPAVEMVKVI